MPAIQLARLKQQVNDLLVFADQPAAFTRELHTLLNFYADRTRRPGLSGKPKPLMRAYNVPRQILRRIETDLAPQVRVNPEGGLALADALWGDAWFESRRLAIGILGTIPFSHKPEIVARLQAWGRDCRETALLEALLAEGAAQLRATLPDEYLLLVTNWLAGDAAARKIGLVALPALVAVPAFENLPALYRLLSPLVRETASTLESDLLAAVRALAARSPQETVYFLQQNLASPHKPGLEALTRRSLESFPPEMAAMLREILRARMRATP